MCKFQKPMIADNATQDEKRTAMFDALNSLDLSDKTEKRNGLTYLSWANAWNEFKNAYPSATYQIVKNESGLPYFNDPELGIMVYTNVTVDGLTHEMWLPVMNSSNKAMKTQPYTYQAYDSMKRSYVEKTVEAATMFDINKTIMRCLVKNLAIFGLGLYIYAGDDLPEKAEEAEPTTTTKTTRARKAEEKPTPKPFDRFAGIKAAIDKADDIETLLTFYFDHRQEIEANPAVKEMLTNRKLQLQQLNNRQS